MGQTNSTDLGKISKIDIKNVNFNSYDKNIKSGYDVIVDLKTNKDDASFVKKINIYFLIMKFFVRIYMLSRYINQNKNENLNKFKEDIEFFRENLEKFVGNVNKEVYINSLNNSVDMQEKIPLIIEKHLKQYIKDTKSIEKYSEKIDEIKNPDLNYSNIEIKVLQLPLDLYYNITN